MGDLDPLHSRAARIFQTLRGGAGAGQRGTERAAGVRGDNRAADRVADPAGADQATQPDQAARDQATQPNQATQPDQAASERAASERAASERAAQTDEAAPDQPAREPAPDQEAPPAPEVPVSPPEARVPADPDILEESPTGDGGAAAGTEGLGPPPAWTPGASPGTATTGPLGGNDTVPPAGGAARTPGPEADRSITTTPPAEADRDARTEPPAEADRNAAIEPAPEATTLTPPATPERTGSSPDGDLPASPLSSHDGTTPGGAHTTGMEGTEEPTHPGAAHRLPRTLAVANQKGGVGKTTTAVNLSAALAEAGYRVLVVDLDPQGNATTGLGINGRNLEHSVYDALLHDVPVEDVIEATALRNLFVVPATIDLAGAEVELVPQLSRELRLRRALDPARDDFDFILIDCPPSLGLLTINGLAAADEVAVPIQCEYYALEGLSQLLRNINLVQTNLNPGLDLTTIIMTMYDARTKLADQVVAEVRDHFGDLVCRNIVPRTVRLSEAPSFGQPIIVFDPSSRGAIAYRELAKEVSGGAPQRTR